MKSLVILAAILPCLAISQVIEEWVATYDGPASGEDYASTIAVDDSGYVHVTGLSVGLDTFDYATVKYNPSGDEEWVARYDGPINGFDEARDMAMDVDGNVYVTGYCSVTGFFRDCATVKYSPTGDEQWVAWYNNSPANSNDEANAIATDDAGNVYITGQSVGVGTTWDYTTVKYNSSGTEEWAVRYNGPENEADAARAVAVDDAGNVYVTGSSVISVTDLDYATIKYSASGDEEWVVWYDGPVNGRDYGASIAVDNEGNVYVTGVSEGSGTGDDYATIKYSAAGDELWVARYDGPANDTDWVRDLVLDGAGNVYVTGHSLGSGTGLDYATVKYSPSGAEQWAVRYDGPESRGDRARAIALDGAGNVYVTGGSGYSDETTPDFATVKYDPSGVEAWIARYDGPAIESDAARDIAVDDAGNVYVTGISYDPETSGYDYCTIKYSQETGIAEEPVDVPGCHLKVSQLSPDPAISYTLPSSGHVSLKVYDAAGQLARTLVSGRKPAGTHVLTWDATDHPAGVYFVRLEAESNSTSAKVVVSR